MINLEEKTLSELKELAKENNIKNISKLKKEDLVEVLGQVLNQYSENSKELASKIEEQKTYNDELVSEKENVNSKEFIEQMAREKLDMYTENERVYIDINN